MSQLPDAITSLTENFSRIPLNKIRESLITLRTEYDEEALRELADSITDKGQLQTIVVQPAENDYFELVIGSRRLRAAKLKGMRDIAAYVIEKRKPLELFFLAFAENVHRVDFNPFEEAQGYLRVMKEFELSLKDLAVGLNKPESYVRNRLQVLSMPEEVVAMVSEKVLPIRHVEPLARLPSGEDQVRFARSAVDNNLSRSELSAQVRQELKEPRRQEGQKRELTPVKVQAGISEFVTFLQKIPRRMNMRRVNASEKSDLLRSLSNLEAEVKALYATIKEVQTGSPTSPRGALVGGNMGKPNNHHQEWTTEDLRKIHAPRRPSDEVLGQQLGRSAASIATMRSMTKDKKKSK